MCMDHQVLPSIPEPSRLPSVTVLTSASFHCSSTPCGSGRSSILIRKEHDGSHTCPGSTCGTAPARCSSTCTSTHLLKAFRGRTRYHMRYVFGARCGVLCRSHQIVVPECCSPTPSMPPHMARDSHPPAGPTGQAALDYGVLPTPGFLRV
jgi:hypothetical protein